MAPKPPKYDLDFDEEEEVGLLGSGGIGDPEPPAEQHSYPPPAAAVSGAPRSVVYHLRPKWPVSEDLQEQDAVSVVGRNRAVRFPGRPCQVPPTSDGLIICPCLSLDRLHSSARRASRSSSPPSRNSDGSTRTGSNS